MNGPADITIAGLTFHIAQQQILHAVDLHIPAGSVLALLGPSGCGKSTLLKLLAGLQHPSGGSIAFAGKTVADAHFSAPPEQRDLGMVFQDYALWPHMTVRQNVAFPLKMRGVNAPLCREKTDTALTRVGLLDLAERYPSALSGGQQQRVALARAVVAEPRILLFDEPLSNLDRDLRLSLGNEMAALLRQLGTTAVYVTHDRDEAHTLAHAIAYMSAGKITDVSMINAELENENER